MKCVRVCVFPDKRVVHGLCASSIESLRNKILLRFSQFRGQGASLKLYTGSGPVEIRTDADFDEMHTNALVIATNEVLVLDETDGCSELSQPDQDTATQDLLLRFKDKLNSGPARYFSATTCELDALAESPASVLSSVFGWSPRAAGHIRLAAAAAVGRLLQCGIYRSHALDSLADEAPSSSQPSALTGFIAREVFQGDATLAVELLRIHQLLLDDESQPVSSVPGIMEADSQALAVRSIHRVWQLREHHICGLRLFTAWLQSCTNITSSRALLAYAALLLLFKEKSGNQ